MRKNNERKEKERRGKESTHKSVGWVLHLLHGTRFSPLRRRHFSLRETAVRNFGGLAGPQRELKKLSLSSQGLKRNPLSLFFFCISALCSLGFSINRGNTMQDNTAKDTPRPTATLGRPPGSTNEPRNKRKKYVFSKECTLHSLFLIHHGTQETSGNRHMRMRPNAANACSFFRITTYF